MREKKNSKIFLLIPDLYWPIGEGQFKNLRLPSYLARLQSRSKEYDFKHTSSFADALFYLFGVYAECDRDTPGGAVSYYGEGGEAESGCWASATPVHFVADRDKLYVTDPARLDITDEEAKSLVCSFNSHYNQDDLSLVVGQPNAWYLKMPKCPAIKTKYLESAIGVDVTDHLPVGNERINWIKIINEIQMLFYTSEVNQSRIAKGKLTINGLWPAGFGFLPVVEKEIRAIYSSHVLAKGLSKLANIPRYELPANIEEIEVKDEKIIVVLTDFQTSRNELDIEKWQCATKTLQNTLLRLIKKLNGKVKDDIVILDCNGGVYHVTRRTISSYIWNLFR